MRSAAGSHGHSRCEEELQLIDPGQQHLRPCSFAMWRVGASREYSIEGLGLVHPCSDASCTHQPFVFSVTTLGATAAYQDTSFVLVSDPCHRNQQLQVGPYI